jgi:hypothetical protein
MLVAQAQVIMRGNGRKILAFDNLQGNLVSNSGKTHSISIKKIVRLMMFTFTNSFVVHSEKHLQLRDTLVGRNADFSYFKPDGLYDCHCPLTDRIKQMSEM